MKRLAAWVVWLAAGAFALEYLVAVIRDARAVLIVCLLVFAAANVWLDRRSRW